MMGARIVILECTTNLHVGSGAANYNIIDNEVEKDPVTGYATIYSTGLKGALREYSRARKVDEKQISKLFGTGADSDDGGNAGSLKIMQADLLARPVRASEGEKAYYLLTTKEMLGTYEKKNKLFLGNDFGAIKPQKVQKKAVAEGIQLKEQVTLWGNKEIYIVKDDEIRGIDLPVIARNKLDNGRSVNLWYEEIVPHDSIFTFVVMADEESLEFFEKEVNGRIIQFGGNASIGYGFCKVSVEGAKKNE